ncbi:unnamed protein product, partial [Hapterophycus canaliculatus]
TSLLSTTEAEYISMGHSVEEALFAKEVLFFLGLELSSKCFNVFVDNAEAIWLATYLLGSAMTQNIDVWLHIGEVQDD